MGRKIKITRIPKSIEARLSRPKPRVDFPIEMIDYKNVDFLKQFMTEGGRILPRRFTGLPPHYQRRLAMMIKRARQMLLLK